MFGTGTQNRLLQQQQKAASTPPVPPPKQAQSCLTNAFKPPTRSHYTGPPVGGTLKSLPVPSLNSVPKKSTPLAPKVPKQRETVVRAFDNTSSFADSTYQSAASSAGQVWVKPTTQMSALHEAVFFDEGDFEDDGDLDFDDSIIYDPPSHSFAINEESFRGPSPPLDQGKEKREPTPPNKRAYDSIKERPSKGKAPHIDNMGSSAPLPWSSSPAEHQGPPSRPSSRVPETVDLTEEVMEAPKKKRKIPWATQTETAAAPIPKAAVSTARPSRAATKQQKPDQQFPWDMTASDVKKASSATKKTAEQKRALDTKAAGTKKKKKEMKQGKIFLTPEQNHVLQLICENKKSVFFTGSAGTGKSVLMREVIAALRTNYSKEGDRVAVTASTGLAACNIGGVTLHSFAGIGLGKESVADLVKKIKRNAKAKGRWLRTKVLVIDEISMVDGELFDKLEAIARSLRNNGRPFGGIQLVITGDFFQLPPVPDYGKIAKFAFDADSWNTAIEHTIGLTQVFRQKDPEFAAILNEMRLGILSEDSVKVFQRLNRPIDYGDGLEATELFPTRQEVDAANNTKMRVLTGKCETYTAEDSGTITDISHRTKLLSNCMAPPVIELKINSQVMLIKNIDETLVNGSLGRIVGFMNEKTFDLIQDDPEAWEAALNYSEAGDEVSTTTQKRLRALAAEGSSSKSTAKLWPLVEFTLSDGTIRQLLVQPEQWKVELPSGEVQACRTQIPLILAWALSIHKAQGQTLERVKVDLGKVFEKGQAYVALSRATCQEGLQVLRFDAKKVMAHEKVRAFYRSLYSASDVKAKVVAGGEVEEDEDEEEMMRQMAAY